MVSYARQFALILFGDETLQCAILACASSPNDFFFFFSSDKFASLWIGFPNLPLHHRSSVTHFYFFFFSRRQSRWKTFCPLSFFSLSPLLLSLIVGLHISFFFLSPPPLHFFFSLFSRRRALQPNLLISQCVRSRSGSNLRDERQQPRLWPKEADKRRAAVYIRCTAVRVLYAELTPVPAPTG